MPYVILHQKLLFLGFYLRNYALGRRSWCPLSKQTHTKCFPVKQDTTKDRARQSSSMFLRTSQDQSHAKPPTSGVLKSLITLGFLPQPHQKNTEHNTKLRTCTNCWRTNRGSYRVFAWNASSQSKNITQ